ncbi:MAG: glycosyltransferase family 39 protein, partial [Bdellovibrionales bacterium]|nr:glycosyltransferase family 39 protein [Bdellovibrionales bacterium]
LEKTSTLQSLLLLGILAISLWVQLPTLSAGLPYFTKEDEAHHFNRIVRMTQTGDFNPHYFHKPSLHFYLRIPFVGAGFLWGVREGHLRKVQEIETRDSFGIGGYAFTASHPGIVKWNRLFSVFLLLGTLTVLFLIGQSLSLSPPITATSCLLLALSPTTIEHSPTIGVDIVVTFFAALTGYISLRTAQTQKPALLFIAAVCAGLTLSSKYNALPIVFLPLFVSFHLQQSAIGLLLLSAAGILVGFLGGSPYILAELPLFLNQFAYEIWHYGIAGHVNHEAEPGIAQATFYLRWLQSDGLGSLGSLLSLTGLIIAPFLRKRTGILLLLFPLLFSGLMISQKANFIRNMLVVLPYFSLLAGVCLQGILESGVPFRRVVVGLLAGLSLLLLGASGLEYRASISSKPESRVTLEDWVSSTRLENLEVGCAGELWLSSELKQQLHCRTFSAESTQPAMAFQAGYDLIIVPTYLQREFLSDNFFDLLHTIPGTVELTRIVENPAISIFKVKSDLFSSEFHISKNLKEDLEPLLLTTTDKAPCEPGPNRSADERYCWTIQRLTSLKIQPPLPDKIQLRVMSPWPEQKLFLFDHTGEFMATLVPPAGQSSEISIDSAKFGEEQLVYLLTKIVRSPLSHQISEDPRVLGASIEVE